MSGLQGLTSEQLRDLILSVGTHRLNRPLSPVEVAEAMSVSMAAGATMQDVAQALGLEDTTMITRFRRLLNLTPEVRHLIGWRGSEANISLTVASEIARLRSEIDQKTLVRSTLENKLSSSEVRQIAQIILRGGNQATQAIQAVLTSRPEIVKRHVLIGAILSDELSTLLHRMTQLERDEMLINAMQRQKPTLPEWTGKLGAEQFTLVGGPDFAQAVQGLTGGFEQAVNKALEAEAARK